MNLLPKKEKEDLKKGLKSRFAIMTMFLVSVTFLLSFITLLPSYFLTIDFSGMTPVSFSQKTENQDLAKILNLPEEINSKFGFFQSNINNASVTDSLYKIIKDLPNGVIINSISFSRNQVYNEKKGTVILLSGIASDRDSMVSFSTLLKNSNSFSQIDMPVSNLTKDKNLPFSINVFIEQK